MSALSAPGRDAQVSTRLKTVPFHWNTRVKHFNTWNKVGTPLECDCYYNSSRKAAFGIIFSKKENFLLINPNNLQPKRLQSAVCQHRNDINSLVFFTQCCIHDLLKMPTVCLVLCNFWKKVWLNLVHGS